MATLTLDTHAFIKKLQASGIPAKQAEAIADGFQQFDLEHVASKADLRELEVRLLKWLIPLLLGQTAVFALIVKWLVAGP